ncbi:uncharacterized protein LOC122298827 [Carya illinoinensis]|uniref:uncharacterized protein LOC122298827 n=1 Tax=Carya illinoinensis TaxID=32201 RepID=UPI001C71BA45|nr:uncharacterized protein LOC122298827 [Carya illinoinensis]
MPNTEKLFIWKACNNILPTTQNLFRKRIVEEPNCPICLHHVESIENAIWKCESMRDVWGLCSMKLQKRSLQNQSFRELVINLMKEVNDEVLIEMAVVAWRLWKRMNELVFQKEFTNPLIILKQTRQKLQDLRLLQSNTSISTARQVGCVEPMNQWKAPPNGHYKINWDAIIDQKKCRMGIGTIIHNWEGQVMCTMRLNKPLFLDPNLAEAYAAPHVVLLRQEIG